MPYKFEKLKLPSAYDRRRKLSDAQKEEIIELRKSGLSLRTIAKKYSVDKRTITFVCEPDKYEKCREQFKERRKDGRYKELKEKRRDIMREHRAYKKSVMQEIAESNNLIPYEDYLIDDLIH